MKVEIRTRTDEEARAHDGSLAELLVDAVDSGASIGFLVLLSIDDAVDYWRTAFPNGRVAAGARRLV